MPDFVNLDNERAELLNFLNEQSALDSRALVNKASDLEGELLSNVVYVIDGQIDMGTTQIKVPSGGLFIQGLDFGVSGLTSSEDNYTMFINPDVGHSGDLDMRNMFVTTSGVGAGVWDLDNEENGGAVECTDFNFVNCTSLGTLCNYRQGLWDDFATIACVDGVTLDGTWAGGFAVITSIIVSAGTPFTGTLFKAGGSLVINGSFRSDMNALQLDDSGSVCDFAPANITNNAEFRMVGVRVNKNSNAFPNMPSTSVKARFSSCVGVRNTYVGAQWEVSTSTATTISVVDTPVKLAGTTTYSDETWFTHTTDNAMVYDGTDEIGVSIFCNLSLAGGNNDQVTVTLRHWVDSTSSFTDLATSGPTTMNNAGRADLISTHAFCDFNTDDRLEVWVENNTDTSSITMNLGGIVSINERPS